MGNTIAGAGKVNWKGVAYYNGLINYMLQIGKCIDRIALEMFRLFKLRQLF
jgi:hypothetical protein